MIDGHTGEPFTMKFTWLPTPDDSIEKIEKIRKQSRQRYAIEKDRLERLLDAWNKKTFSQQEMVAEKAKLEGYGVTEKEFENIQNDIVQQHEYLFSEWTINGEQPDAIVYDTENSYHKAIFYKTPEEIQKVADLRVQSGNQVAKQDGTYLNIHVDMLQHKHWLNEHDKAIMLRVGKKEDVYKQLEDGYGNADYLLFVPNINKLEEAHGGATSQGSSTEPAQPNFTVDDIKLNEWYDGYVKLSYNYGIFVTVKGVEGLLHKNFIIAPDGVERKKYFNV